MDSLFYRKDKQESGANEFPMKYLKNKRFMLKFIAGSILAAVVLFGDHGIVKRVHLSLQKSDLQEKIIEAEKESKRLQAASRALDADTKAIEKAAREKHGMIREGETVYKVHRK